MVEKLMKLLDITEEQAKDIIECDKKIDQGEKLFELTEEQKQNSKKLRAVGRKVGISNHRERQADDRKKEIIQALINGLPNPQNINILNNEREFTFVIDNRKYKVVLSCPRK